MLPLALSGVLGALAGFAGFSPILFVRRQIKRGHPLMRRYAIPLGIVSIMASLLLLMAMMLIASQIAPEWLVAFAVVTVVSFLIANTWYAVRENRQR